MRKTGSWYRLSMWIVLMAAFAAPSRAASPIDFSVDFDHYGETSTVLFRAWIPDGLDSVKGLMLALPGSGGDIRNITTNRTWQQRLPAMGFGIVGAKDVLDVAYWGGTTAEVQSNFQNMLDALASAASRQEVSNAPLFSFGHSKGAFAASMVAQGMPERTLGFFSDKTIGFANDDLGVAASVPGLSVAGEGDEYSSEGYARLAFDSWRGQGAEVALAVEGGGHNQTNSNLRFAFIDEVLKVRYPHGQVPSTTPGNPLALRPVDPSDGWLADSATLDGTQFTSPEWPEIAPVGEYSGDPTTASWLPSKTMALVYRAHVHEPVGANPTDLGLFVVYDDIETLEYAAFVDFPDETYESIDVYHEDRFVGHLAYNPTTQRVPFMPRRLGNTTVTAVAKYLHNGETHYTSAYTTYNVTVLPDVVPEPVSAGLLLAGAVGLWIVRRRRVTGHYVS